MARKCDTCGVNIIIAPIYYEWQSLTQFMFCKPSCKEQASQTLGIVFVDHMTYMARKQVKSL